MAAAAGENATAGDGSAEDGDGEAGDDGEGQVVNFEPSYPPMVRDAAPPQRFAHSSDAGKNSQQYSTVT